MLALKRADESRKTLMEYLENENRKLVTLLENLEKVQGRINKDIRAGG
jgi:hypothetical protein